MSVQYEPRMKRMKISHIMRKYKVTEIEARSLRAGRNIKSIPVRTEKSKKPVPARIEKLEKSKLNNNNDKEVQE